jgi:hypothetical protein
MAASPNPQLPTLLEQLEDALARMFEALVCHQFAQVEAELELIRVLADQGQRR